MFLMAGMKLDLVFLGYMYMLIPGSVICSWVWNRARRLLPIAKGPDAKLLAIRALERIHDAGALELLARLSEDPAEVVRQRAQRAHQALTSAMAGSPAAGATYVMTS